MLGVLAQHLARWLADIEDDDQPLPHRAADRLLRSDRGHAGADRGDPVGSAVHHLLRDGPRAPRADRDPLHGPGSDRGTQRIQRPDPRYGHKGPARDEAARLSGPCSTTIRSEEHTSELQSLMRISYAV